MTSPGVSRYMYMLYSTYPYLYRKQKNPQCKIPVTKVTTKIWALKPTMVTEWPCACEERSHACATPQNKKLTNNSAHYTDMLMTYSNTSGDNYLKLNGRVVSQQLYILNILTHCIHIWDRQWHLCFHLWTYHGWLMHIGTVAWDFLVGDFLIDIGHRFGAKTFSILFLLREVIWILLMYCAVWNCADSIHIKFNFLLDLKVFWPVYLFQTHGHQMP